MEPSVTPPFPRPDEAAPTGVCARWMGEAPCGAAATMHIIWDLDMRNGPVCPRHDEEARQLWAFIGRHPYEAPCGRQSIWDPTADRCLPEPEHCDCCGHRYDGDHVPGQPCPCGDRDAWEGRA